MRAVFAQAAFLSAFVLPSAAFLWWGTLPPRLRRLVALAASAAGVVFLTIALGTAGQRETATMGSFVLGPGYVSGHAAASASLPYYVITAVCLLAGTTGLAVPDPVARRLSERPLGSAIALTVLVTLVRFALEKAAAPSSWTWAVGVTWLPPLVGAFFAVRFREQARGLRALAPALLIYGLAARGCVALTYLIATAAHLGSHYDLSSAWILLRDPISGTGRSLAPGSLPQLLYVVLVPQLLVWPLYTLLVGMLAAGFVFLLAGGWRPRRVPTLPVEMATAPQDH